MIGGVLLVVLSEAKDLLGVIGGVLLDVLSEAKDQLGVLIPESQRQAPGSDFTKYGL